MPSEKKSEIREALLVRATGHVLKHGLTDLSLRRLGDDIGSSARMLLHHFGSKEQLVSELLVQLEHHYFALLEGAAREEGDLIASLTSFWHILKTPDADALQRVNLEVWGRALVRPKGFEGYLKTVVAPWTAALTESLVKQGLLPEKAQVLATLVVASFFGLILQRLTSGENALTDRAFEQLMNWLRAELKGSDGA